ncbi:MAG: class I SAM-dependent methyltransferase [Isosphaeraceae bacterium]|jgi:SAM-dependent methyltransferase
MDVSKEVAFFDSFETEHGEYDVLGKGAYRRLLGLFGSLVRPREGERCFDLGCGTGAFTRRLSAFNLDLTGVDISPRSIEAARKKSGHERYLVGDIRATNLADGEADIILYSGVLHHCNERAMRVEILREGLRILRPGGRLFAFDPSAHSPSMWLYRDPRSPFYSSKGKTENEVLLTRQDLRTELEEAGFSSIRIRGVSGISYTYVEETFARLILPLYNLYEAAVRFSPFEDRYGTFLLSFAVKPD